MSYDPLSVNAQLSSILTRLDNQVTRMDAQDKMLEQVLAQCIKTNGRVNMLESFKSELKGKVAVLAAVISAITAWIIKRNV
ncbi:MAG: hypothetical protein EBR82_35260 [Caulobacteraceae bacterium]|nr:hypothetical protein [Caulobacteraceae bacterium]